MSKTATAWVVPIALSGALLAASWLHAASGDAASIERGRAHLEKTCLRCHAGPQLDALVRGKLAELDGFLAEHHAADPALRADVIAALEHRLAAQAGD
ncbi:MAG: hypothetical protein HKP30_18735 [Myxococcales bacterium]|nr:hypothetical protein [Myxococcales bacterium]